MAAWGWRRRGRYRQFPFLMNCLPVLLAGGIGGTLYHAFRTRGAYFWLDVIPIQVLALAGSIYLSIRLGRHYGWRRVLYSFVGTLSAVVFVSWGARLVPNINGTLLINISYAGLAGLVVGPMVVTLIRTRFRYAGFVWAGVGSFAIAWFCRLVDRELLNPLPMGSRWPWHTFGAAATALVIEYYYRVERDANQEPTGSKRHADDTDSDADTRRSEI